MGSGQGIHLLSGILQAAVLSDGLVGYINPYALTGPERLGAGIRPAGLPNSRDRGHHADPL